MVQMRNEFLDSAGFINKNQAEYSILTDLYNACSNKCFLFQLKNLDGIKTFTQMWLNILMLIINHLN